MNPSDTIKVSPLGKEENFLTIRDCIIIKQSQINSIELNSLINLNLENHVIVCEDSLIDSINYDLLDEKFIKHDILHAGLLFIDKSFFKYLQYCGFNWFFLNPGSKSEATSWKSTVHFVAYARGVLHNHGGFDDEFDDINTILAEFSYRALQSGGQVQFNPDLLLNKENLNLAKVQSSYFDQFYFIKKHLSPSFIPYLAITLMVWKFVINIRALNRLRKIKPELEDISSKREVQNLDKLELDKIEYSAIIPTLNRYDYLKDAIYSLINCSIKPKEIIVVDQTAESERPSGYYNEFENSIVKVIFLEEKGQSISRNLGIKEASTDWIFLFDDDSLLWQDAIRNHFVLVQQMDVSISTGVSLSPGESEKDIPRQNQYTKISHVLDTGNCLIKKSVLEEVDLLDIMFDHGSGVDDDLGKRIYLRGLEIIWNPLAIRTHYKAKTGGLRTYGAWWRNKTGWLKEYPPYTQTYSILKYYNRSDRLILMFLFLFKAKKKYNNLEYILLILLFPYKATRSYLIAKKRMKIAGITSN